MHKFREHSPKRTFGKSYKNYRDYKVPLASDFENRCGYTNCPDSWFGGTDNFHIDHFIPWKKYVADRPELKTEYSNLVYSCSYVNILKSNDEGQYLDPCTVDYNEHFARDRHGMITANPESPKAVYMHKKMKLYLTRYQVIWLLDMLNTQMEKLTYLRKLGKFNKYETEINALLAELIGSYLEYKRYLYNS